MLLSKFDPPMDADVDRHPNANQRIHSSTNSNHEPPRSRDYRRWLYESKEKRGTEVCLSEHEPLPIDQTLLMVNELAKSFTNDSANNCPWEENTFNALSKEWVTIDCFCLCQSIETTRCWWSIDAKCVSGRLISYIRTHRSHWTASWFVLVEELLWFKLSDGHWICRTMNGVGIVNFNDAGDLYEQCRISQSWTWPSYEPVSRAWGSYGQ